MQAVCYYRETLDAGLLERALTATLERYPILAGRLDLSDPDPSRKGVRLTNDGANFRVVRDADTPFDALPRDYADESRRFLDYEPWIDIMLGGAPVFTANVTQLANGGGSVLGVCMSHAVSDGQGFVEFLVAWARRAAGEARTRSATRCSTARCARRRREWGRTSSERCSERRDSRPRTRP